MSANVSFRPLSESDGPALAGLSFSSADDGVIRYAANYQIDAIKAIQALHDGEVEGIAVSARERSRLVGVGLVRFGQCMLEGALHPYALIGNLIVHPDYRGQGLAAQVVEWLLGRARDRFGDQGIVLANWQSGNKASRRLLSRWLERIPARLVYQPMRTRPDAPAALRGVMVGPLDEDEYAGFAEQYNAFYSGFNLHRPADGSELAALCRRTPLDTPFRHAYIAVDESGRLLAGLMVMEEYRLKQMEIRGVSRILQLIDKTTQFLPPDGTVREVYLDHIWHLPGQGLAARHLVETVRWIWANRATHVSVFIDPRSPLGEIFPTRLWSVAVRSDVAIQAPRSFDPDRWLCAIY